MNPCSMPKRSWRTRAIGARQFVVHDAFDTTVWTPGRRRRRSRRCRPSRPRPGRRGHDDPLRSGVEVRGGGSPRAEMAAGFDHDFDVVFCPRDLGRFDKCLSPRSHGRRPADHRSVAST